MIQVAMNPQQFEAAKAELAQQGIYVGGSEGVIQARDVTANYDYDGVTLSITVTHAPLGMDGHAEKEIRAALLASMAG